MIKNLLIFFTFCLFSTQGRAQNWEPVPCFNGTSFISRMFVDSLHNEIILNPFRDYNICSSTFKGLVSYNGSSFNDLDFGIDAYNAFPYTNGSKTLGCITYKGKTLYGGYFSTVGSNTLVAEALALWNGSVWDSFPSYTFKHNQYFGNTQNVINGFFKENGELWIYGIFDTLGGIPGKNLFTFDGVTFNPINIPASNNYNINKIIKYKNELYIAGSFYNLPNNNFSEIIRYKNGIWNNVENGIRAPLGGIADMMVYKDTLYIAGAFFKSHGNAGNNLLKWDGTKFHDAGFGDFYNWSIINQLIVYKDRLYAFGGYSHAANKKAFGVAYYENGKWVVPKDSIDNAISNAVLYKDEIYVSGGFWSINGDSNLKYFAKLRCPDFEDCKTGGGHLELETSLFPNPASVEINIHVENAFRYNSTISVYNNLGQLIFKDAVTDYDFKINCERWPKGIYLLVFQNANKRKSYKLIKE